MPQTQETQGEVRKAKLERALRASYRNFNSFFRAYHPGSSYIYGDHTVSILNAVNQAIYKLENGENSYTIINIPQRHGKSDIISRRLPVWTLLRNPTLEIILASYNQEIAEDMSIDARACYREICNDYGRSISNEKDQIKSWKTDQGGGLFAVGFGGTATGRGANLLIIDDFFKSRLEAESETIRKRVWESIQSDFMTRLAPVHAVIILANRWHVDDPVGRIIKKNNLADSSYDPEFPKFNIIKFPAQNEQGKWLFTERFSEQWYKSERALMGNYAWSAQGLQNPQPRRGNMLRADMVQILKDMPDNIRWVRGWDLASSEKERMKDDPDYTVGTKLGLRFGNNGAPPEIFIDNVIRGQWTALKRDEIIKNTALKDGSGVHVYIEAVAGYKDTYTRMKGILSGHSVVRQVTPHQDKVIRASAFEPIFEIGNVYIREAPWNHAWLEEIKAFPSVSHDDQVDSVVIAGLSLLNQRGRLKISK